MEVHFYKTMKTPVGELKLVTSGRGLIAILWENDDPARVQLGDLVLDDNNEFLGKVEQQLNEYFSGTRTTFDLRLDFVGTEFQKQVWEQLLKIPYGETCSYGHIAKKINRPKACRAVGAANGKNPISIVAACHRVIGASGKLIGFAGGLRAKQILLTLEAEAKENS